MWEVDTCERKSGVPDGTKESDRHSPKVVLRWEGCERARFGVKEKVNSLRANFSAEMRSKNRWILQQSV